jgi:hypothetical protein
MTRKTMLWRWCVVFAYMVQSFLPCLYYKVVGSPNLIPCSRPSFPSRRAFWFVGLVFVVVVVVDDVNIGWRPHPPPLPPPRPLQSSVRTWPFIFAPTETTSFAPVAVDRAWTIIALQIVSYSNGLPATRGK